ncbi:hypothetical protein FA15DRAFT_705795 [Coprinopsis marcescibilis]|uniref:F-box domain-containing protein n=1 Tax=Coprinopsis marcescibilis TaxID=230819 RepID=A0A5C3KR73_COPMA|nr:hypothetical protein FA15DRAFT_705795 [Coprinopsis marcescibilis]
MGTQVAGLPPEPASITLAKSVENDTERRKSREAQREFERETLDNRIAALEKELFELKCHRNRLSSISQLPPEILSRIFFFCERSVPEKVLKHGRPHWVNVTHVSHYWRNVALGCPSLWSNIHYTAQSSQSWTQAMLDRSQSVPLAVGVEWFCDEDLPSSTEVSFQRALEKNCSRLEQLYFQADSHTTLREFLEYIPPSVPNLRTLSISDCGSGNRTFRHTQSLKLDAPKLRDLRLINCRINWTSPLLRGLTSLRVWSHVNATGLSNPPPTAGEFLQALENMPALESLSLKIVYPDLSSMKREPVQLHHLQDLSLDGPFAEVVGVLRHLSIPTTTRINLACSVSTSGISRISTMFGRALHSSWLSAPLAKGSSDAAPQHLKSLVLSPHKEAVIIYGWFLPHTYPDWNRDRPELTLQLDFEADSDRPRLAQLLSRLPIAQVRSLALYGVITEEDLVPICRLPFLQKIALRRTIAQTFLEYMAAEPSLRDGSQNTSLNYLPQLQVVAIDKTDFYGMDDELSVEELLDFLMIRYEFGVPVQMVEIRGCYNLHKRDVCSIKHVVGEMVYWDGVEERNEPEDSDEEVKCEDTESDALDSGDDDQ